MLGDDTLVLNGHLPACEGNHARPESDVALEERRALERRSHRRDSNSRAALADLRSASSAQAGAGGVLPLQKTWDIGLHVGGPWGGEHRRRGGGSSGAGSLRTGV